MATKKAPAHPQRESVAPPDTAASKRRWVKLSPRDHVLKQIELQRELVQGLREQLQKEEKTLEGMEKAKEFFPA